jgi:uncharacterized membrane protein YkoI
MRKPLLLALVTTAILAGSLAAPAHARPERGERGVESRSERAERGDRGGERARREAGERRKESRKSGGVLTRDEAARRAQRQHGGRVLSVDLLQSDNAPARYRIKLLSTNGTVRTVDVDALED